MEHNLDLNNIGFFQLTKYLHSYHISGLHDILNQYKEELSKDFKEWYQIEYHKTNLSNIELKNPILKELVNQINFKIIKEFYIIDDPYSHSPPGIYYQDNKIFTSEYHIHENVNIVSTMYIDPPNEGEGGEFNSWVPPYEPTILQPKKDFVYFVPGWVIHKPLPQTTNIPRICINWTYVSNYKPVHKISGARW